ncbi:amidohydrolase [Holdemania massiliensis]|uniref:amidohydrolase n=1 Tax=Holdemania massiliensis TaxID=1468449 RepID=UPI003521AC98
MIAITHGKLLTVTNGTIEDGTLLIDNGKITAIGTDISIPEGAEVINASEKWVTPGLIDAHTHISTFNEPHWMPHIGDGNEITAPVTAQIRGIDALNPFDMAISVARSAGFTTCYTGPGSANVIGGTGLSFKLKNAATVQEIAIEGSEMMKMALGENPKRCYGSEKKMPMTRMGTGAVLRKALFEAKQYSDDLAKGKDIKRDFDLEALVPVVRGEMRCRIHCHRADDIVTAIRIAEEFQLDYTIEHCTEGYKILDFLKAKKAKVVIGPLLMGPQKFEIWGCRQDTPAVFEKAGIQDFCLMADDSSATKWLPVHVGIAMRQGLSFEQALKCVTINPARLLQLEDRVGSLEVGKDADIAIFNGMPFSNLTLCEQVIIDGKREFTRQQGDL